MTAIILYGGTLLLLWISFLKDRGKTKEALIKSWRAFENVMPQFLGIIFVVGLTLAIIRPESISNLIGKESGFVGVLLSAVVGAITMVPTFIAFSTAELLLADGAGYAQIGALVSTLTLVGVVTFTLETKYIGKKAALYRNLMAFIFSFIVAFVIGLVLGGRA